MTRRQLLLALERLRKRQDELQPLRSKISAGLIEHASDSRELALLALRYGIMGPPRSLGSTAELLGISKSRAAQLEARALRRLESSSQRFVLESGQGGVAVAKTTVGGKSQQFVVNDKDRNLPELVRLTRRLERMGKLRHQGPAPNAKARNARNRRRQALEAKIAELERAG